MSKKETTHMGAPAKEGKGGSTLMKESYRNMPLVRLNFILMAISGAMIVLGFLLMLGSGTTIEQFNPDVFSPRRIVVGPTICFLGYVGVIVSIIIRPKARKNLDD